VQRRYDPAICDRHNVSPGYSFPRGGPVPIFGHAAREINEENEGRAAPVGAARFVFPGPGPGSGHRGQAVAFSVYLGMNSVVGETRREWMKPRTDRISSRPPPMNETIAPHRAMTPICQNA
jgi:hypothetical protein